MKPISEMTVRECLTAIRSGDYLNRHHLADRIEQLTRWIPVGEGTIPDGKILRVKINNPEVELFGFYDKELREWRCNKYGVEVTHYQSMTFPDTKNETK
jgi:hypothetical protein